jgi:hypothetical protein
MGSRRSQETKPKKGGHEFLEFIEGSKAERIAAH